MASPPITLQALYEILQQKAYGEGDVFNKSPFFYDQGNGLVESYPQPGTVNEYAPAVGGEGGSYLGPSYYAERNFDRPAYNQEPGVITMGQGDSITPDMLNFIRNMIRSK